MSTPGKLQGLIGRIGVWYLGQKNVARILEATGLVLDGAADSMVVGMRRSQPYRCTPDAFGDLSKDRKIRLYPNESEASKRWRLAHWRQIRRTRGCHYGEMVNVQPFFLGPNGATIQPSGDSYLPTIRTYHQSGDPGGGALTTCHTLGSDGSYTWERAAFAWNWDGQTAKWSRSFTIIYLPANFSSAVVYDSGAVYDGGAIYDGIPSGMVANIVAGLLEAKAPHYRLSALIFTTLRPTDSIPGFPGVRPFDPQSTLTTNADWSTNLPAGNWGGLVYTSGPHIGLATRPPWASFGYQDNG